MRIILADHNPHALWALVTNLVEEPDIELAGAVTDALQLQEFAAKAAVELVLLDNHLPGLPIENLIASLRALTPRLIVVVMSSDTEDSRMILRAGADAFVSKADQPDWLLNTLRRFAERAQQESRPG